MDTKLIQQYGTEILSYRLRTVRQKKRMQYEDFDKQLIQLRREGLTLHIQRRNLGWEPLVPPIQKGWNRFFVLREDVARGNQAEFFENILMKINTCEWSHRKDFKVRKRRYGRYKYGVREQSLLKPYACEFEKLGFTESEKQFFHEKWEYDYRRRLVKRFVFNEPWRFVLRIKPNIIDKVRKRDELIEKRIIEIDRFVKWNNHQPRLLKLFNGRYYGWWKNDFRKTVIDRYKNRSLQQVLNDIDAGLL